MSFGLAGQVERIRKLDPYLACAVGRDMDGRWTSPADPGRAGEPWLEMLADEYASAWGVGGDRCTQATLIVLDYSWYACAPLVASYLLDGVVPRLDGAEVRLDPATRTGGLALADQAARSARSVDALRDEAESFLAPLVEAVATRRWLSARVAWLGIGDRIVSAFEYLGAVAGDPAQARLAAEQLVHAPGSRLDSPRHRFVTFSHRGVERTLGARASCCRFHRTSGGDYCLTCPLIGEDDRCARVIDEIDASLPSTFTPV